MVYIGIGMLALAIIGIILLWMMPGNSSGAGIDGMVELMRYAGIFCCVCFAGASCIPFSIAAYQAGNYLLLIPLVPVGLAGGYGVYKMW